VLRAAAPYIIVSTIDANDHRVDCERLLVPFGSDGSKVEQILASLQLTSVPGRIQRTKILNNFQMQADLLLSGKIRSGFSKSNSSIEGGTCPRSRIPSHWFWRWNRPSGLAGSSGAGKQGLAFGLAEFQPSVGFRA
jgi:hypothetical protein